MSIKARIRGVFAAALTPMNRDGSLALSDWPELLDYLVGRGCHGALLLGTTGEGPSMSTEERIRIVHHAVAARQDHPGFQILVGTGTPSLEETIAINLAGLSSLPDITQIERADIRHRGDTPRSGMFERQIKERVGSAENQERLSKPLAQLAGIIGISRRVF